MGSESGYQAVRHDRHRAKSSLSGALSRGRDHAESRLITPDPGRLWNAPFLSGLPGDGLRMGSNSGLGSEMAVTA